MQAINRSPEEVEEIKVEIRRWYNRGLLKDTFAELMSSAYRNKSDSISDAVKYAEDNVGERYQLTHDEFLIYLTESITNVTCSSDKFK